MKRGLRVLGHPVHAVLSDFPIALMGTSLLWDSIGIWRGESVWWAISFWSIVLGLCTSVVAALAGAVDYVAIPQDDRAQGTALRHMLLMLSALAPYLISVVVRGGAHAPAGNTLYIVLGLELLGVLLLSIGGWFGGHLVFHHGVGRSEP